jgi:putative transposase
MDETYARVKGAWKYLDRAVDKAGATADILLTAKRDRKAALRFLRRSIVEHDHRAIKRLARPMLGFKSFRSAAVTLAGIKLMHMIRKGRLRTTGNLRPAQQLYSLAG